MKNTPVKIIPLGGFDRIGMNMTAIEYEDSIMVVDCGVSFPQDNMPGIDTSFPDITYLLENRDRVKGFVITHGHEDHMGALPYVLRQINAPVYGTPLTVSLIEKRLQAFDVAGVRIRAVRMGYAVTCGAFRVEFIRTNHSIPDAAMLAIYTPAGTIVHTGDFKVDFTPLYGDPIDLRRLAALGTKGVLALISDSTNALVRGMTPSEVTVVHRLDQLFSRYKDKRIIIATFASNVDRVQHMSMLEIFEAAQELGYRNYPEDTLIKADEIGNYDDRELVLITTGSQGEPMAALTRMAEGTHEQVKITENDVVIYSSTPIPGNERALASTINLLEQQGATMVFQDAHVSGHACEEDLKLIYSLLTPRYAVPAHGNYRHRYAGAQIALRMGVPKDQVFMLENGDVLSLTEEEAGISGRVKTGEVLIDGSGIGDVGSVVLASRQSLGESGVIVITLSVDHRSGRLLADPEVITRGLLFEKESGEILTAIGCIARAAYMEERDILHSDLPAAKGRIKYQVLDYIRSELGRSPVVLPVITRVVI